MNRLVYRIVKQQKDIILKMVYGANLYMLVNKIHKCIRKFCGFKLDISGFVAGRLATKITSLNSEQIYILNQIPEYSDSIQELQRENLKKSLYFMLETQRNLKEKYPYMVNLEIYILNRLSILYKLTGKTQQLIHALQDVYLMSISLNGYNSFSNLKHLRNLYIALIYNDPTLAQMFIEYLDSQIKNFPSFYINDLKFYSSIVLCMDDQTLPNALENLATIKPSTAAQKIYYLNNLAWFSLWYNKDNKPKLKQTLQQCLSLFKQALQTAQFVDSTNMTVERKDVQQKFLKYIFDSSARQRQKINIQKLQTGNRNSPVICLNIGEIYYYLREYDQASFWLQLALQNSKRFGEFNRVTRAIAFTAKILQQTGFDQDAERIFIDTLENAVQLPAYSRRFVLQNYMQFLHTRERFVQSLAYNDQIGNMPYDKRERLQGILMHDYDFSY